MDDARIIEIANAVAAKYVWLARHDPEPDVHAVAVGAAVDAILIATSKFPSFPFQPEEWAAAFGIDLPAKVLPGATHWDAWHVDDEIGAPV